MEPLVDLREGRVPSGHHGLGHHWQAGRTAGLPGVGPAPASLPWAKDLFTAGLAVHTYQEPPSPWVPLLSKQCPTSAHVLVPTPRQ